MPQFARFFLPAARAAVRPVRLASSQPIITTARAYSTDKASPDPLIRVKDLPAPNGGGHFRVLSLNRPAARNALSRALLSSLREEIDAVARQYNAETGAEVPSACREMFSSGVDGETGPTRALIIGSEVDSCFCAGADLKERRGFTQEDTNEFLFNLRSTFAALEALPIPTISAISSRALGGGLELALCTHFRVVTSNVLLSLPETRLAIIPGAGGTHRLTRLIGTSRARDMILTGRPVGSSEALAFGLVNRVAEMAAFEKELAGKPDADKLLLAAARQWALTEAIKLAGQICEGGPVAIRAALRAVEKPSQETENRMYERVVATEDRNEALRAFAEKRKPSFLGR